MTVRVEVGDVEILAEVEGQSVLEQEEERAKAVTLPNFDDVVIGASR
jgi:hypothetical protein